MNRIEYTRMKCRLMNTLCDSEVFDDLLEGSAVKNIIEFLRRVSNDLEISEVRRLTEENYNV